MKKTPNLSALLLIFLFVLIVGSLACNIPTSDARNFSLNPRAEDGSVSGSYHSPNDLGDKVNFSVTPDGFATFHLEGASESEMLTVDLSDEQTASLAWSGTTLDGLGPLTVAEQTALDDLMSSQLAQGLKMIPLDIGCQGADEIDPKQVAALLVPLQMRFKYLVSERATVSQELIALSQCDYGDSEEGQGEKATFIMLSRAAPVPVVLGYFPFDAQGAVETPISLGNGRHTACLTASSSVTAEGLVASNWLGSNPENFPGVRINQWGPCNAVCRGACGANCEPRNCKESNTSRCEKDDKGNNTGMSVPYLVFDCGLHDGCIDHDYCYDQCNSDYGCDSWEATLCRHGSLSVDNPPTNPPPPWWHCDQKATAEYGSKNTSAWVLGYGPQPIRETFEYIDYSQEKKLDLKACPLEEAKPPALDEQDTTIPVGTYFGTTDYPQTLAIHFDSGQYTVNKVTIHVAEDGTVSGSYSIYLVGDHETEEYFGKNCTGHGEVAFNGEFQGQLTSGYGTIGSSEMWDCKYFYDCNIMDVCSTNEPFYRQFDIQVNGDHMKGSTLPPPEAPDGWLMWTFDAVKE